MANQDVSSPFDHLEGLIGGLGERGPGRHTGVVRVGHKRRHPVSQLGVGSDLDHEDREVGVVLGRERIKRFVQPCPVPAGHNYCDHGGRGLLGAHKDHERSRAPGTTKSTLY